MAQLIVTGGKQAMGGYQTLGSKTSGGTDWSIALQAKRLMALFSAKRIFPGIADNISIASRCHFFQLSLDLRISRCTYLRALSLFRGEGDHPLSQR